MRVFMCLCVCVCCLSNSTAHHTSLRPPSVHADGQCPTTTTTTTTTTPRSFHTNSHTFTPPPAPATSTLPVDCTWPTTLASLALTAHPPGPHPLGLLPGAMCLLSKTPPLGCSAVRGVLPVTTATTYPPAY